jgi:hypothetical protein
METAGQVKKFIILLVKKRNNVFYRRKKSFYLNTTSDPKLGNYLVPDYIGNKVAIS